MLQKDSNYVNFHVIVTITVNMISEQFAHERSKSENEQTNFNKLKKQIMESDVRIVLILPEK